MRELERHYNIVYRCSFELIFSHCDSFLKPHSKDFSSYCSLNFWFIFTLFDKMPKLKQARRLFVICPMKMVGIV